MKSKELAVAGVILMLIGFFVPKATPLGGAIAAPVHLALSLCYIFGIVMLILAAIRHGREKKRD